uniref:Tetrapyrrole methylase domain-containing protein n=2 Tax=Desulfobacterium TaxID=2295 RepID=E1YAE7_9BACT|nr:hypothetical protein N47_H23630 [uncultured Desulfobacterium sp.]
MTMKPVKIIGTGLNPDDLSKQTADIIAKAQVLVGGKRLLDCFADPFADKGAKKIPVCGNLNEVVESIKAALSQKLNIVVLADGDPGFYGIADLLVNKLGKNNVEIFPNITTLQCAASRLKISWKDIVTVSLHGRSDLLPLLNSLSLNDRVGVFTDQKYNPAKIAEQLLLRGVDTFRMIVFENLCTEAENICELDLKDALNKTFSALNFVILDRIGHPEISLTPGMDEDTYIHQKGLITKKEVRAAGLAALKIRPDHTVWDLGAGCGSVAIEASVFAFKGRVVAVEKEPERVLQIKENIRRMGAYAVDAVCGDMPECLQALPDPDRIFIGGGLGHDDSVLIAAANRLKPGGRLVLHLVLTGSLMRAIKYLNDTRWPVSISQILVSRSVPLCDDMRLESQNPVFIVSSKKC